MPAMAPSAATLPEVYAYWGDEHCEETFATATKELERGCHFEEIFTSFAVAEAASLDDHHVVVSGETYIPSGILAGLTSKFLSWAVREGLVVVTPRGIAHASFGN